MGEKEKNEGGDSQTKGEGGGIIGGRVLSHLGAELFAQLLDSAVRVHLHNHNRHTRGGSYESPQQNDETPRLEDVVCKVSEVERCYLCCPCLYVEDLRFHLIKVLPKPCELLLADADLTVGLLKRCLRLLGPALVRNR